MWASVGILVALLALDALWAGWAAYDGLQGARASIATGSSALRDGDLTLAAASLTAAEASASQAASFGSHPSAMLAGALPVIGDDVHAVESVASAAELASSAGSSLTAALVATGWTGEGLPGVGSGGQMDPGVIRSAQPSLEAATSKLDAAVETIRGVDTESLVPPLATAVTEARTELEDQASLVGAARDLSVLLPPMLGDEAPRTYLLAFQNLSAPRGTGGFLGFYGELRASNGTIALAELRPTSFVPQVAPVPVPPDVARRYGPFGVRTTFWAANYPPDVPTSSEIALEIARSGGLGSFDGMIWTDTAWLAGMLGAVGPVETRAWPEPLTAENLIDVLNRQTFLVPSANASDELQARIGLDVWDALLTRPVDAAPLASAMASATSSGHFAAYSVSTEEQGLLAELDADGAFELGPNPIAVVWQDAAASRAAYFADKRVSTEIALDSDGTADVATTVTLRNDAPTGPPSILLGTGKGATVGSMALGVEVYLPEVAERVRVKTSAPSVYGVDEAFGRPVGDCYLYGDPGQDMTCTVGYRAPEAAARVDDVWEYRIDVRPQPSLSPMPVEISFTLPEGASVVDAPTDATVDGTSVTWSGEPTQPTTLVVRYA